MTGRPLLAKAAPLLLSDRRAASVLGVSRDVVAELRRSGRLRAVPWFAGHRIPLAEVERLALEGVTAAGRRPRATPRRIPPGDPAASIRSIKLEDL